MKKYCVQRNDVYRQDLYVEAENAEEALQKALNDDCVEGEMYYDYTLEPDESVWPVFEIK